MHIFSLNTLNFQSLIEPDEARSLSISIAQVKETLLVVGLRNGNCASKTGGMEKLSGKDKDLIRDSWESLGKNKVPHGIVMFTRLFELDPALLNLFKYKTKCGIVPECLSSPEFLEHVTKVMVVIDAAVNHLDDLHTLEDFLLNLGRKHQAIGVKSQSFSVVGEALLYMLQCNLGSSYTAALRQAWLNMYNIVVTAMSRGWAKNTEHKSN